MTDINEYIHDNVYMVEQYIDDESVSQNFEDCLILEVQSNSILYDLTDPNYNNQKKKDSVWATIAANCGRSVNECKRRWKSLRDRFRTLYSQDVNTTSGQASTKKIDWQYYEPLKFLIPTITQAPSFSNYSEANTSSEHQTTPAKRRKKDILEDHMLQYLQASDEEEIDSDKSFVLSLVDQLKSLPKRKNALARIKIQEVIYQLQYDDE